MRPDRLYDTRTGNYPWARHRRRTPPHTEVDAFTVEVVSAFNFPGRWLTARPGEVVVRHGNGRHEIVSGAAFRAAYEVIREDGPGAAAR